MGIQLQRRQNGRGWFPDAIWLCLIALPLLALPPGTALSSVGAISSGEPFLPGTPPAVFQEPPTTCGDSPSPVRTLVAQHDKSPLPGGWFSGNRLTLTRKAVIPSGVILAIGASQSFSFAITVKDPGLGRSPTDLNVTSDAKWRYIDLSEPVPKTRPCNDRSICLDNTFTCKKVGSFTIAASYSNRFVTDPADSGGAVRSSASIQCVDPGFSITSAAPRDILRFTSGNYSVKEDAGPATLMVERAGKGKGEVTVIYTSRDETAKAGSDYDRVSGFLAWKDGDLGPKPLYVFVRDDNLPEGDERVRLILSFPTGHAELGHPSESVLTIQDAARASLRLDVATDTGSLVFAVGDTVTYRYTLTIPQPPGNIPLSSIALTDSGCRPLTPRGGDSNGNGRLDPGETWTYECRETLASAGTFTHAVIAAGSGPSGERASDLKRITIDVRKNMVAVPDVRGYRREAAEYDLKQAGLRLGLPVREEVNDAPVGEVFAQRPLPGTLVNPGSAVEIWVSRNEPRSLFLDPPRTTIKVGEEVRFTASLITKDRNVTELAPGEVTWNPGPLNVFRGRTAGVFTVTGSARGVSGWATVTVEEEERTAWERPISHAGELTKRAMPPPRDAFTWYALCVKGTGDVVYGEDTNPVKFKILGGPFQGPRDAAFWIGKRYPSWRCDSPAGLMGEWNVFCDRQRLSVVIGKNSAFEATRYWIMQSGFTGEKDARAWTVKNCPTWMCSEGGGCAMAPRSGGDWAVVCAKAHGGIGLTRQPDPVTHWIFASGLLGEKDARMWVNLKCPSWRCDRDGRCLPGMAGKRERPLELPPFSAGRGFSGSNEGAGDRRIGDTSAANGSRGADQPARTRLQTPSSRRAVKQGMSQADCGALRNEYMKKTDEMVNRAKRLNCYRDNSGASAYSGCAMDVVGPFFPFWADRVFSDAACKSGYAACMAGPFSSYLGCLDACNSAFRAKGGDLKGCGRKCYQRIQEDDKGCKGQ
jgi:hypothetical protein